MLQDKETINIDLKVPTSWEKLNEKQLRYVFGLIAHGFAMQQIKTYCLFRWSGLDVIQNTSPYGDAKRFPDNRSKAAGLRYCHG